MSNTFLIEHSQDTLTLTLNRPEQHNAFDDTLIAELIDALQKIEQDNSVRTLILTGAGRSFSAGADLNWMKRMAAYSSEENREDALQLAKLMQVLNDFAKPTLAMVQGAAFGGGVGLAACCDIVLASDNASFCLSEVKLGLIPAVIAPYVIAKIGQSHARRYFLTAERFDAQTAQSFGLVHEVVAADQLQARAHAFCELLHQNGPQAMTASKALIRHVAAHPLDQTLRTHTATNIAEIRTSPEGKAGIQAFLNKTPPPWQS